MLIPPKAFLDDVKAEIVKLNKKPKNCSQSAYFSETIWWLRPSSNLFQNKDPTHMLIMVALSC